MEPVTLSNRYGSATVRAITATLATGEIRTLRYEITTPTGYRANIPACQRDECQLTGTLKPCVKTVGENGRHSGMSVRAWDAHCRTHCHGNRPENAVALATAVLATYGPQRSFNPSVSRIGLPASAMPRLRWREAQDRRMREEAGVAHDRSGKLN